MLFARSKRANKITFDYFMHKDNQFSEIDVFDIHWKTTFDSYTDKPSKINLITDTE